MPKHGLTEGTVWLVTRSAGVYLTSPRTYSCYENVLDVSHSCPELQGIALRPEDVGTERFSGWAWNKGLASYSAHASADPSILAVYLAEWSKRDDICARGLGIHYAIYHGQLMTEQAQILLKAIRSMSGVQSVIVAFEANAQKRNKKDESLSQQQSTQHAACLQLPASPLREDSLLTDC